MSNIFEMLQPSPRRESVLKKISCRDLTAVDLPSSPDEFKLVERGRENIEIEVSGNAGMVPVLALKFNPEIKDPQKIPTRHAALVPMDDNLKFSVLVGHSSKSSGFFIDVDIANKTVSFETQIAYLDEKRPIQVGRHPEDMWRDGAPQTILFPEETRVARVSSKHLSLSIIDIEDSKYILIEDLSKFGTSVQFNIQNSKEVNISDPNIFISDPEISFAQLKTITGHPFLDSNPIGFDSQSGGFDSKAPSILFPQEKLRGTPQIGADTAPSPLHIKNEDAYEIIGDDASVLADGMGGHKFADIASKTAVIAAAKKIVEIRATDSLNLVESKLRESIQLADIEVRRKTNNVGGTTLSIAKIVRKAGKRTLVYAHSGDSRIVIKSGNHLIPVTQDHGLLWRDLKLGVLNDKEFNRISKLLDSVEDPSKLDPIALRYFKNRNIISECVGRGELDIESGHMELQDGDQVVLYTDGVSDNFTTLQIVKSLDKSTVPSVQAKILVNNVELYSTDPDNLYHKENNRVRGKPDDITVIVME